MKSYAEIESARTVIAVKLQTPGLTDVQKSIFAGMLNALMWVADDVGSSTMNRLLAGDELDPGKDHTKPMRRFRRTTEQSGESN